MPTAQKAALTASTRFSQALAAAEITLLNRIEMSTLWPLAEILEDKVKNPMVEIRGFIEPIVRNAMKKREHGGDKDDQTLLGHLLNATDGLFRLS